MDKALFGSQGRRQYCYDSKADKGTAKRNAQLEEENIILKKALAIMTPRSGKE